MISKDVVAQYENPHEPASTSFVFNVAVVNTLSQLTME